MPKSHTVYPPEVWRQMVDLVHAGGSVAKIMVGRDRPRQEVVRAAI